MHTSHLASLTGKIYFQAIIIKISYRRRGKDARAHITILINIILMTKTLSLFIKFCKNKTAVRHLKLIIIRYSAMKKIANFVELYSTLNPDTSSDSPSEKSKGVRFNSAKILTSQIIKTGKYQNLANLDHSNIFLKDKYKESLKILTIINLNLIS